MRDDTPFTPSSNHFCRYAEVKKLYWTGGEYAFLNLYKLQISRVHHHSFLWSIVLTDYIMCLILYFTDVLSVSIVVFVIFSDHFFVVVFVIDIIINWYYIMLIH
jgi:hypothetical protein